MDSRLGGWGEIFLLVSSLAGYVVQSQFAQHLQMDLGYRQPYFIFYLAHSSFSIIFPLHLAAISCLSGVSSEAYVRGLKLALSQHFDSQHRHGTSRALSFPIAKFLKMIGLLTLGATVPSLLWYISVSLTSISDVTAILNTNAFWTYALTVWLAGGKWQTHRLLAVIIAVSGVFLIVYGGNSRSSPSEGSTIESKDILGDLLTLLASFAYSVYQVLYKLYAALSLEPPPEVPVVRPRAISSASHAPFLGDSGDPANLSHAPVYPTLGLHPNLLTTCIGLYTLVFLWIPIPLLHVTGIEPFRLPPDWQTWASVLVTALCGVCYNAGFMVLLALWGPVLATVANLLTIVLVFLSDTIIGHAKDNVTVPSLGGAAMIVCAFAVLVAEAAIGERKRKSLVSVEDDAE
ncbi:hypothetical protein BS47DRAFT_1329264 [Hydnum rufescens UP504]|uniref:EamA domain-containing protein n=1 Tax=Hydnum rufescens UP504 TaxID=1448309 RepID=A0A9P6AZR6_9AGAM|nr:hypothetical protein BS47DRAFT_1329264 [Hydnum rufescens UP504]